MPHDERIIWNNLIINHIFHVFVTMETLLGWLEAENTKVIITISFVYFP